MSVHRHLDCVSVVVIAGGDSDDGVETKGITWHTRVPCCCKCHAQRIPVRQCLSCNQSKEAVQFRSNIRNRRR